MSKTLLHVGCGSDPAPDWTSGMKEVRLDIDDQYKPDIVANMLDMGDIGEFDVVLCQHALEHLYPHEVTVALSEFKRVLKEGGIAFIVVPDLEDVRPTDEVILEAPIGPITGLDMIYGYRPVLKEKPYMAHKTGFVESTLKKALNEAGFDKVFTNRNGKYNLIGVGKK
jgi:SAM-dependent methyltransferase